MNCLIIKQTATPSIVADAIAHNPMSHKDQFVRFSFRGRWNIRS
jgi:hypothetical protein